MSKIFSRGITGYRTLVLTVGAAVAVSGAGLFAIVTDASRDWTPPKTDNVTSVDVSPWSGDATPAEPRPFLNGENPSKTQGKVEGTGPATIEGEPASAATPKNGLTIKNAVFGGAPMAAPAANEKGSGDFTGLPGASSGAWGVTGQTGAFTWSYPFSTREAPAGPTPSLALAYDSSSIDGLTSATNNQASVVGDGWSLAGTGSITQRFGSCMDQGVPDSYDLCGSPAGQQFTISFGGRSGTVIKDKDALTPTFRLQNDDNTRVEYLTAAGSNGTFDGGYWKLTDTNGTQYFFGRNHLPGWAAGKASTNSTDTVPVGAANATQPCAAGTFAASLCQQAYAWNLDYVVDVHGNSQAIYYTQDTNSYSAQAGTGARLSYVRASRPVRVDYGMRTGSELDSAAPLRVEMAYTGRCTGVDCSAGNDIPSGFACQSTGTCTVYSPTFYTDQRLLTVTTRTATSPTAYQDVDVWTLHHSMPDPGDLTKPALWLGSIDHKGANTATGVGGAISDPPVVFGGQTLQNRVWVVDGLAPLDRYRISSIKTVTGASIAVTYQAPECSPSNLPASPETNTKRCFPQWWAPTTPIAQPARMDYFHIYPVASVSTNAGPGGSGSLDMISRYEYQGTPAWKYAGPKYVAGAGGSQLTWSVNAGWAKVKTISGNGSSGQNPSAVTTYLRGRDGTPANSSGAITSSVTLSDGSIITDSPWLAGSAVETEKFLGESGPRLSSTITMPWYSEATATGSANTPAAQARHIGTKSQKKILASSLTGGTRTTTSTNYFDGLGRTTSVSDSGEAGGSPGTCTVTAYADNPGANLLALPATTSTYAGPCTSTGAPAGNLLKANRTLYDGSTEAVPGASGYQAPALGNTARTDIATAVSGTTVTSWQTGPSTSYDTLGRPVSSTDNSTGTARTTSVAYTPSSGLPTSATTTNPLGWKTSTAFEAIRGNKVTSTDENGNVTSYQYDASGRVTGVWDPMRPKATNAVPTEATGYTISQTAPSSVIHTSINGNGEAISSYEIYDGLGRVRQTQKPSPGGGTIAADTFYNNNGAKRLVNNDYYYSTNPGGTLMVPNVAVPSSDQYDYDGAGRITTVKALTMDNQELWTTRITYTGVDTSTTTGPGNEPATRTIVNTEGNVTSRLLYKGTVASGTPDVTSYGYNALGQMTSMTDTASNQWTWSFDPAGRQVSATDPDTGTLSTTYDATGRAASTTDTLGTVTSYTYDDLDRKTATIVTPAGGTARTLQTITYDGEKKGQVSSATRYNGPNYDQAVTTAVSGYNAAYLPGTTTTTLPASITNYAGSYTTTQTYTSTGNVKTQVSPAIGGLPAETLNFGYDSFENPSSIANQNGDTIAGGTEYSHLNNLATFQQYDRNINSTTADTTGLNEQYFSWDATTGRLANQSATNRAKGAVADLGTTSYTYTPSGKLTARELSYANRPGAPADYQCYNYDYASRLAAVWTPAAKNCSSIPTPASTSVTGLGGLAPYAQTYGYTPSGDRSEVKRFDAAGALASTENYTYPGGPAAAGAFVAKTPFRQLDTRNGTGGVTGPVGAGQTVRLKVTGKGGIPATGVSAVALNITVTAPTADGNITAYAGGTPQPSTSNVNFVAGETTPNFAITPVGADGTVSFTNNSNGTVHLIADTSGYFLAGTPTVAGAFDAKTPFRQLDTRNGTGGVTGPVGAGQTVRLKVTGKGGIPASGVSAVALNITVTAPTAAGNITAYAGGTPQPSTSNVNFVAGETTPNFAITPVGADGTVSFTNNSNGTVHLLADTSGYYLAGTPTDPGAFDAKTPFRQLDTRNGTGGVTGPVGAGQTVRLKVTGKGGIPATGVSAVALNITVTAPTTAGNITAYAGGTPQPSTSNVNFVAGQTTPNFAITPVGADGTVSFTNNSNGTVHLIADTSGYYLPPATGQPGPHRLQSLTSTPASGAPTTSTFTWDAAGRMTGRSGQTLAYTPDGLIATSTGTSTLPANPNPSAGAGTPPAPAAGTAGSTGTRYYDAGGNLVGLVDGSGTTVTLGSVTAHSTPGAVKTATCTYTFAGKTVAQRTAAGGAVKLMFLVSDSVDTAQTVVLPTEGATLAKAVTRFTDPSGLARGATQTATGSGSYSTAAAGTTGVGSNAANPTGFSAVNGYIAGLADTVSALTHLGARDLDPVLGVFTAPDPLLDTENSAAFTPYAYSANDPINYSDPSGLFSWGDIGKWVHDNAGTIANVVTAVVVTAVVVTAATACVASVVCGIGVAVAAGAIGAAAGYAAGNAVDVALGNKPAPSQQEYWAGMAQAAGWGAAGGILGGAVGAVAGKAAPYLGRWIGNAVSASRNAASAAAQSAPRLIAAARQAAANSKSVTQSLGNKALATQASPPRISPSVSQNVSSKADFVAGPNGVVVPTSESRMLAGFRSAGFPEWPTSRPGTGFTLPDGSKVRVMQRSGTAPKRASFTDGNDSPISPFTGRNVPRQRNLNPSENRDYIRSRTHVELW
ncbi:RHS repeat-associated core domain-containing protein [Arthrobacter sp. R4-81]